jgi:hypothetical protein
MLAVIGAGRGMYYAGSYALASGQLRREGEFTAVPAEELPALIGSGRGESLVVGELEGTGLTPAAEGSTGARVLPAVSGVRRPGFLCEIGRWLLATQGPAEAALLQPLYLRRVGAE